MGCRGDIIHYAPSWHIVREFEKDRLNKVSVQFGHISLDENRNLPLSTCLGYVSDRLIEQNISETEDWNQPCATIKFIYQIQDSNGNLQNRSMSTTIMVLRTVTGSPLLNLCHEIEEEILRVYSAQLIAEYSAGNDPIEIRMKFDDLIKKNLGCPVCLDMKVNLEKIASKDTNVHTACAVLGSLACQKATRYDNIDTGATIQNKYCSKSQAKTAFEFSSCYKKSSKFNNDNNNNNIDDVDN